MIEAGPFGPQGHSLSFLGLRLRFWLWFRRQLLFFSIHLAAGQASESPAPIPECLSVLTCLLTSAALPGHFAEDI